jgi:HEAT repeat protein
VDYSTDSVTFRALGVIGLVLFGPVLSVAQTARPASATQDPQVQTLAQGWSLLASGKAAEASTVASQLIQADPNASAPLELAVRAEIALQGSMPGLSVYERWLGAGRRVEPVYVLREIAAARLREAAAGSGLDSQAALEALLAAGDRFAREEAQRRAAQGTPAGLRLGAASGDPQAVAALIKEIGTAAGSEKTRDITALGRASGEAAARQLESLLSDPRPENRAAAIEALARVQGPAAAARIEPLLRDSASYVRHVAAGALYGIGDMRGATLLQQLAASDVPAIRSSAAGLMASQPDASWQTLVRGLLQEQDPLIRLNAARLIAPHDPAAARRALEGLAADRNIAVREEAGRALPGALGDDIPGLRRLLRDPDPTTAVNAASSLLALTASSG